MKEKWVWGVWFDFLTYVVAVKNVISNAQLIELVKNKVVEIIRGEHHGYIFRQG